MADPLSEAIQQHQNGCLQEALRSYQAILNATPDNAEALHLIGVLAHQLGHTDKGLLFIEQAIALRPREALYHRNRAELLKAAGELDAACEAMETVVALSPGDAGAHNDLGQLHAALGRDDAAMSAYETALRLHPDLPHALNNIGHLLAERGDNEAALAPLRRAVETHPEFAQAHNTLGAALWSLERIDDAIDAFRAAIALAPEDPQAHVNLGQLLLLKGALAEGWREHEHRLAVPGAFAAPRGVTRWRGEPLGDRRLLVCAEQGVGDEILYAGCVADLIAVEPDAVIELECDPRLAPLMARAFQKVTVRATLSSRGDRRSTRRPWLAPTPPELYIPAGSLPALLRRDPRTATAPHAGYLVPDAAELERWRHWLDGADPGHRRRRIGLCWRSSAGGVDRASLSAPLAALGAAFSYDRHLLVCLQHDARSDEMVGDATLRPIQPPRLDQRRELDRVAALMCALDLVVSAPTAVCELAGALGRPVVRIVRGPDWSNLGAGDRRPWNPDTRLVYAPRDAPPQDLARRLQMALIEAPAKVDA